MVCSTAVSITTHNHTTATTGAGTGESESKSVSVPNSGSKSVSNSVCGHGEEVLYSPWALSANIHQAQRHAQIPLPLPLATVPNPIPNPIPPALEAAVTQLVTDRQEGEDDMGIQLEISKSKSKSTTNTTFNEHSIDNSLTVANRTSVTDRIRATNIQLKDSHIDADTQQLQEKLLLLTINRSELTRRRAVNALKMEQMRLETQKQELRKRKQVKRVGGGFAVQFSKDI